MDGKQRHVIRRKKICPIMVMERKKRGKKTVDQPTGRQTKRPAGPTKYARDSAPNHPNVNRQSGTCRGYSRSLFSIPKSDSIYHKKKNFVLGHGWCFSRSYSTSKQKNMRRPSPTFVRSGGKYIKRTGTWHCLAGGGGGVDRRRCTIPPFNA